MSFAKYEIEVVRWLEARKIIPNSTPQAQFLKTVSEVGELADAINKKDMPEIKDAIGDITVTLIAICALYDIGFVDCLAGAYGEIKDRKGTLLPNGIFVKDKK